MNRYHLFYQPKTIGDVLLIIIEPSMIPTHTQVIKDSVLIYHDDRLIGVNLFNVLPLVKIHAHGLLLNPPPVLIDIVNHKFANDGVDVYLPPYHSPFITAKVKQVDDVNIKVTDGLNDYLAENVFNNMTPETLVVIAKNGTLLPNGHLVAIDSSLVYVCPERLFDEMGREDTPLIVTETTKPGSEYFHWE